jgi:hypothetical protein
VVTTGTAEIVLGRMLSGFVRALERSPDRVAGPAGT